MEKFRNGYIQDVMLENVRNQNQLHKKLFHFDEGDKMRGNS